MEKVEGVKVKPSFFESVRAAKKEVATWPEWKKNLGLFESDYCSRYHKLMRTEN